MVAILSAIAIILFCILIMLYLQMINICNFINSLAQQVRLIAEVLNDHYAEGVKTK